MHKILATLLVLLGPVVALADPARDAELAIREATLGSFARAPLVVTARVLAVAPLPEKIRDIQFFTATVAVEDTVRGEPGAPVLTLRCPQSPRHVHLVPGARGVFRLRPHGDGSWRVSGSEVLVDGKLPRLGMTVESLAKELEVRDAR